MATTQTVENGNDRRIDPDRIDHALIADGGSAWRDEETLRELYNEKRLSISQIADKLGCSYRTVWNWMDRFDIERRSKGEGSHLVSSREPPTFWMSSDGHVFCSSTLWDEESTFAIHRLLAVAEYGFDAVCGNIVHDGKEDGRLPACEIPWANWPGNLELMTHSAHSSRHGLEREQRKWGGEANETPPWRDEETLREAYSAASIETLAGRWGCHHNTILNWLNKYGIEVREQWERPSGGSR